MNDQRNAGAGRDYRETLFLPKTDFPMKAGLPQKEPEILEALAGHGPLRQAARCSEEPRPFRAS